MSVSRSENTWKPPESVRIGPSQLMKEWSPPSSAIRSSPGRKCRWYVLPSKIVVPIARSSSGSTDFTVAFVPTGMKAGVGTSPCAVCSTPARARSGQNCGDFDSHATQTEHVSDRREPWQRQVPGRGDEAVLDELIRTVDWFVFHWATNSWLAVRGVPAAEAGVHALSIGQLVTVKRPNMVGSCGGQ